MPYVASKVIVLGVLNMMQAAIYLLIIMLRVHFPDFDAKLVLSIYGTLYIVYISGMTMGLVISAFVANEDRATGLVPLVVIPQMTLAGTIITIGKMPQLGRLISNVAVSRWSFEILGSITNLQRSAQCPDGCQSRCDERFPGCVLRGRADEAWHPGGLQHRAADPDAGAGQAQGRALIMTGQWRGGVAAPPAPNPPGSVRPQ